MYSRAWEEEDEEQGLSGEQITKRILPETMNNIEDYLKFTAEVGEEYEGGWLPTLDMEIRITGKNEVVYRQYEKPVSSKRTVQRTSAMGENIKHQILSQDMIRRLKNTSESLGGAAKVRAVDQYSQKLRNSGYMRDQIARIITNGVKGYEGMRRRRIKEGRALKCTASKSWMKRFKNKLLEKTTWFKKKKRADNKGGEEPGNKRKSRNKEQKDQAQEDIEYRTVLFVNNTGGGELASRIKELTRRLAGSIGFGVKVVERNGNPLRSLFPLNNLWDGAPCGRKDCTPCNQEAEELPKCNKTSLVYENICKRCNTGAGAKEELKKVVEGSLYVGESSRTLYERSREHDKDWRDKKERSHIAKHQGAVHGLEEEPQFIIRPVRFYKTALSRQIGEAGRIRRRGGAGAILNSKSEFSRCKIPRLVLEEIDEEQAKEQERKDQEEDLARIEEQANIWGELERRQKKMGEQ